MYRFWDSVTRPLLDSLEVRSIVEIGVEDGRQTELLLSYATKRNAVVHSIDPVAPPLLPEWRVKFPSAIRFYETLSLEALPFIEQYDVVLIDGDHNWYTVYRELMEIDRRAKSMKQFPVVLLHDIGWPYARRDQYCNPDTIPASERQPYEIGGVHRDWGHLDPEGLNVTYAHATIAGGSKNGVLTAVEDFLTQATENMFFANIPGMHGLGILTSRRRLRENAALTSLIQSLTPASALHRHITLLEDDRVHGMLREVHTRNELATATQNARVQAEQLTSAMQGLRATIASLASQARASSLHDEEQRRKIRALEEAMRQLGKDVDEWQKRAAEYRKKADELAATTRALDREIASWKETTQAEQHRSSLLQAEMQRLQAEMQLMRDRHSTLRQERSEQERTVEQLMVQVQRLRSETASLKREKEEERLAAERRIDARARESQTLQSLLDRIRHTKSWRYTEWLRTLDARLQKANKRIGYGAIAFMRRLWRSLGEPFPTFTRQVRLRVFGKLWPLRPTVSVLIPPMPAARDKQPAARTQSDVSVIVASRNYGQFLAECLTSINHQTVQPKEIIYVDDGSTDDSVDVATRIGGVTVLALPHRGAPAARNSGVKASTGSLLLHVDGDDILPPDFLETHLRTLQQHPEALFAYGPAQAFGLHSTFWDAPEWSRDALWLQNFVNTSALVRRGAFEKTGGWREDLGTMWDWDLWLRLSQLGPGVRSPAAILYRQHQQSWGHTHELAQSDADRGTLMGGVRRGILRPAIGAVLSGRLPSLFPQWLDALAESLHASPVPAKPELILLDNSGNNFLSEMEPHFDRHRATFSCITVVPLKETLQWTTEIGRRDAVANLLARAYNTLLNLSEGDVIWFVEDDVIVPRHAYTRLLTTLTDGIRPRAAVSGLYRNRHVDEPLGYVVDETGNPIPVKVTNDVARIDLSGTGCLMILRPLARHPFRSHWKGSVPAHDWAWSEDLQHKGHSVWLDPTVLCRHHVTKETFV